MRKSQPWRLSWPPCEEAVEAAVIMRKKTTTMATHRHLRPPSQG